MPRRLSASLVATLLFAWLLAACTGTSGSTPTNPVAGSRITVVMVTHGQSFDPFWSLVQKGAQQAASDFNVALTYQSPSTTNPQAQAAMITQAAAKKPDAMVVSIPAPAVLAGPIRQVSSSGIPVVVVNVGDRSYQSVGALTFVGQADYLAGVQAAKAMAAAGVRHALCVIHEAGNTALTDRCAGFTRQLAASGGSVQTLSVNGAQLHQADVAIQQALKRNPDINGVLTVGILGFEAAGGALHSLNKLGTMKFGTFDVSRTNLTAVQNGQLLFVIDQQPFLEGYAAVQAAAFDVRYGQHPFQPIYTGPSFVTKANVAQIQKLYKNTGIALFQGGYPQ
ncbi:sugar ABC transporter substrate-binding protein [Trebonia kvetii]|uniref:Sugar ABC transporter substrate-binding protein n=1 Tax=Trebonia kvetii TaxID=2480626 RepID=A0A6P2BT80_9ACTN|nr:substrate-binding domain-containing protein [Trebonia kvetii]TVZ02098.1 sugar ABC transporter substrate-binding protein [Trebonia kvetii]